MDSDSEDEVPEDGGPETEEYYSEGAPDRHPTGTRQPHGCTWLRPAAPWPTVTRRLCSAAELPPRLTGDDTADDDDGDSDEEDEDDEDDEDEDDGSLFVGWRLWVQIMLVLVGVLIGVGISQPDRFGLSMPDLFPRPAVQSPLPSSPPRSPIRVELDKIDYEEDEGDESDESDDEDGELPAGWSEHREEASGKAFYYHSASTRSQWSRPTRDSPNGDEKLPDGWTRHEAPDTGRPYYHEKDSGQTTWERPGLELPEGWVEHWDQKVRRQFYHRQDTGESMWEVPEA